MCRSVYSIALMLAVVSCQGIVANDVERAKRWEKEISAIEKRQLTATPPKGGIVFAGSSTIRLWNLDKSFPEMKPINSGFGGSEIRDSTQFAERIILKHEPRAIVMYAGDNDINSRRTPEQVAEDFRAFVETVHKKLPKTKIFFISIKPSIARWKQFETQSKANKLVRELCAKDERLGYIDIVAPMLGEDGKPKAELFVKDGLHLSDKGYAIVSEAVTRQVK